MNVADHPIFKKEGSDIVLDKEIKISEAVLGTTIEVPTLEGSKSIKVPPGTQSNSRIRLKGFGLPRLQGGGKGDEYVRILIRYPKNLNEKQRKLAEDGERRALKTGKRKAIPDSTGHSILSPGRAKPRAQIFPLFYRHFPKEFSTIPRSGTILRNRFGEPRIDPLIYFSL